MRMQIMNDSAITGSDGAITYINGVEMHFKDIPEGQHEDRLIYLTELIKDNRLQEKKLSQQRARLITYIVKNKLMSVIKVAEIIKVSRQRVYKIIDSKQEEE
mgnify:FL=1|tara:strand:+ start:394 stop:699 length:306 start_codon:yes stop_codon:yes gene_type:complete